MSRPEPMHDAESERDPTLDLLLDRAREALSGEHPRPDANVGQKLLTAGVAIVAQLLDEGVPCRPFSEDVEVTPTEVALVVCAMLEAADIDMPQLNMWQALGGVVSGSEDPNEPTRTAEDYRGV